MDFSDINWLAIAIATLANMLLAYLWFGPFFGERWLRELGKEESDLPKGYTRYVVLFLYSLATSLLFWYIVPHFRSTATSTAQLIYLVFLLLPTMMTSRFSGRKFIAWESFFFSISYFLTAGFFRIWLIFQ
jgi:hypothetical protein